MGFRRRGPGQREARPRLYKTLARSMLIILVHNVRGQNERPLAFIISLSKLETPSRVRDSLHIRAWLTVIHVDSWAATMSLAEMH